MRDTPEKSTVILNETIRNKVRFVCCRTMLEGARPPDVEAASSHLIAQ